MPIKDLPNLKNTNLSNIIDALTKNRSQNKMFPLFGIDFFKINLFAIEANKPKVSK